MIRCVTNEDESVFSHHSTQSNTNTNGLVMTSFWRGQLAKHPSAYCVGVKCRLMRGRREKRATLTMTWPWKAARGGWQKEALKRTDVKQSNMYFPRNMTPPAKVQVQRRPKEREKLLQHDELRAALHAKTLSIASPESLWKALWKAAALKWTHSARLVLVLFARRLPAFHTSRNVSLRSRNY